MHSLQGDSFSDIVYVTMKLGKELWNSGTDQIIVSVDDYSETDFMWSDFKITSCTSVGGRYQLVLAKGAPGFSGEQRVDIFSKWEDFLPRIEVITGICYNSQKQEYMVVSTEMTDQPFDSCDRWFNSWDLISITQWKNEKLKLGMTPKLIFRDPTNWQVLIVVSGNPRLVEKSNADFRCYPLA